MLRRSLGPRFRGDERRKFASTASWLLRRDRGFVETLANVVYKVTGLPLGHARNNQRVKPAGAFDDDLIPDQAAGVSHLGDMRQRQMLGCGARA
jgi:hypothetical protein